MPKLPVISGKACIQALLRLGFSVRSQEGSSPSKEFECFPLRQIQGEDRLNSYAEPVEVLK